MLFKIQIISFFFLKSINTFLSPTKSIIVSVAYYASLLTLAPAYLCNITSAPSLGLQAGLASLSGLPLVFLSNTVSLRSKLPPTPKHPYGA